MISAARDVPQARHAHVVRWRYHVHEAASAASGERKPAAVAPPRSSWPWPCRAATALTDVTTECTHLCNTVLSLSIGLVYMYMVCSHHGRLTSMTCCAVFQLYLTREIVSTIEDNKEKFNNHLKKMNFQSVGRFNPKKIVEEYVALAVGVWVVIVFWFKRRSPKQPIQLNYAAM